MPAGRVNQTLYLGTSAGSNIENMNEATLYKPGELGGFIQAGTDKSYQLVKLDSGAVAAAGAGVVAAGDVAFWKDRASFLVTNSKNQAVGGPGVTASRNSVAGVFTVAATAGYYCVVQQRGRRSTRSDGGGDFAVGEYVVASANTVADIDRVAAATAPPYTPVGRVAVAESGGFTAIDLDIPVSNT